MKPQHLSLKLPEKQLLQASVIVGDWESVRGTLRVVYFINVIVWEFESVRVIEFKSVEV